MKITNRFAGVSTLARFGVLITALAAFCGASAAEGVKLSAWRPLAAQYDLHNSDSLSRLHSPFAVDKNGSFSAAGLAGIPLWGQIAGLALVVGAAGYAIGANKNKDSGSGRRECAAGSGRRVFARPTEVWNVNPNNLVLPPASPGSAPLAILITLSRSLQDQHGDYPTTAPSFGIFIQKIALTSGAGSHSITVGGVETMVVSGLVPLGPTPSQGPQPGERTPPLFTDGLAAAAGDRVSYSSASFGTRIIARVEQRTLNSGDPRTEFYRVYQEVSGSTPLFLAARLEGQDGLSCGGDLSRGEFFLSPSFVATTEYSTDNLRFRRDNLQGWINPDTAIHLGGFLFTADSQLQNMHLENRSELFAGEDVSLLAASGFRRQDDGKTSVIYGKLTALKTLSPQLDAYVQTSFGDVNSDIYKDAALSGLSLGVFAEQVFRWDDSAHLGLERRFGDADKELWQLSANMQIGGEESHVRFGFNQDFQGGTQANVLYRRQF